MLQNIRDPKRASLFTLLIFSLTVLFIVSCGKKENQKSDKPAVAEYLVLMKEKESGKYGYMDSNGNTVVQPIYFEAGKFSSGRGRVRRNQNDPFIYIDATGRVAIQSEFVDARDFSEGLAAVKLGDLWGYIDTTGKVAIEPKFQIASEFDHGRAKVQLKQDFNGKTMVTTVEIDPKGNLLD
ncbi:MAG: WG repeat-containing protein [Chloroherpetonaceae bacterium]|nr:WG repeat-containing protein [Chloroherpetonaceae bacterium]